MNISTFQPTAVWLTTYSWKSSYYYKTCQIKTAIIKQKTGTGIQYNKYYSEYTMYKHWTTLLLFIINNIIIIIGKRREKVKTVSEETMACAKILFPSLQA